MPHRRYLVTDYDDSAFSFSSTRPDNLSQPILNMARSGNYDGFYGCTHRAYSTFRLIDKATNATKWVSRGYYRKPNENFSTYKITENFSVATGLPNIAVSTPDDRFYRDCGEGYRQVLKPYEMYGKRPAHGTLYLSYLSLTRELNSKNCQLLQIAQDASIANPDCEIELDYVDDKLSLCQKAIWVDESVVWPKNVHLNIYHYSNGKVMTVFEPERFFDPAESLEEYFDASDEVPEEWVRNEQVVSALRANSMFAGAVVRRENIGIVKTPSLG